MVYQQSRDLDLCFASSLLEGVRCWRERRAWKGRRGKEMVGSPKGGLDTYRDLACPVDLVFAGLDGVVGYVTFSFARHD